MSLSDLCCMICLARQAGLKSASTVAGLVDRFNQRSVAALGIAPGRGRKPTYDVAARARIVTTAQRPPGKTTANGSKASERRWAGES